MYYYQAISKVNVVALLEIGGGLVTLCLVVLLMDVADFFRLLCWIFVLVRLVILLILEWYMFSKNQLNYAQTIHLFNALSALRNGREIFYGQVAASLYTTFNIVMLGSLSSSSAVAVYGSSERLIRAVLAFINQTTSAVFPVLNSIKRDNPLKLNTIRLRVLGLYFLGAFAVLPVAWILGPTISNLLFHNTLDNFVEIFSIMSLVIPAIAISNVLAFHFLTVDNKENMLNLVMFAAVPVSLIMGYFFSKKYGAEGMTITWVAVEWLITLVLIVIIYYRYKANKE
jgi:PST family polysaccharide transporter